MTQRPRPHAIFLLCPPSLKVNVVSTHVTSHPCCTVTHHHPGRNPHSPNAPRHSHLSPIGSQVLRRASLHPNHTSHLLSPHRLTLHTQSLLPQCSSATLVFGPQRCHPPATLACLHPPCLRLMASHPLPQCQCSPTTLDRRPQLCLILITLPCRLKPHPSPTIQDSPWHPQHRHTTQEHLHPPHSNIVPLILTCPPTLLDTCPVPIRSPVT
jgi:hypothetical protein